MERDSLSPRSNRERERYTCKENAITPTTYDLLVIGAGAAGGAAAHTGVERGARVAQIERDKIGGTCLNYGCDPTKTLLHIAQMLYRARHSDAYGLLIPLSSLMAASHWIQPLGESTV